jgi:tRNA threonylcarbamoyladenosine biosynthesis protein TsaE
MAEIITDRIEIESNSVSNTIAFAKSCANSAKNGDIFTLQGPMGAGKSEFARGFIRDLMGEDIDVPSPTFTLVQTYETPKGLIWHFDLYRLKNADEIYEIGWEEALSDGILLVEWPERLGSLLPMDRKEIIITPVSDESRNITLDTHGKFKS